MCEKRIGQLGENIALLGVDRLPRVLRHHKRRHDALENRDLRLDLTRNHDVGGEAGETVPVVCLACRLDRSCTESTNELTGQVFQPALVDAAGIPGVQPDIHAVKSVESGNELVVVVLATNPGKHRIDQALMVGPGPQCHDVDVTGHNGILKVVHRVCDVI